MPIASLARRAVKAAALPAGLVTRRRPDDLVILLYHRIGDGEGEIELPETAFERHLRYLRTRERVVTLDQALADGAGGIVVTFDDGYLDFYDRVVPLLVKHEVPALLYLATGLVANGAARAEQLTWSHLREAVATGWVTVGSHTHDHVNLAEATEVLATAEMRRSKEMIEDKLGSACRHFAYPWAVASPDSDRVARVLFESAALDAWKTNRRGRTDPHRLGRTPILASDGRVFFRAKVKGALDGEALFYRALQRGPWRFR